MNRAFLTARLTAVAACTALVLLWGAGEAQARIFGNRATDGADLGYLDDIHIAGKFTLSTAMTAYGMGVAADPDGTINAKLLIYEDDGGAPGDLVACVDEMTLYGDGEKSGARDGLFSSPVNLSAGDYWLSYWADQDAGGGSQSVRVTTSGGDGVYFDTVTYTGTCPTTWGDGTEYATWNLHIWVLGYQDGDTEITFYGGHGGYTQDAYADESQATEANYGHSDHLKVGSYTGIGTKIYPAWMRCNGFNDMVPAGSTVDTCICSLYVSAFPGDNVVDLGAYRVFKPWVEGYGDNADINDGVTRIDWDADDLEWTTTLSACARDNGVDNSTDGGACTDANADRKATPESEITISAINEWIEIVIPNALAQEWVDGDANQEGVVLLEASAGADQATVHSCEKGIAATDRAPRWYIAFTPPAAESGQVIIIGGN